MTIKTNIFLIGIILFLSAPRVEAQQSQKPVAKKRVVNLDSVQTGVASYYAAKFHGRKTASGERYDSTKLTAAHNGLPFGTWVKVTNRRNNMTVIVKINDRLHHANTRVIDLSAAAARKLGFYSRGLTKVRVEVLGKGKFSSR